MKDKLQIVLLSVIAVALVAIAVAIYTGNLGGSAAVTEAPMNVKVPPVAPPAARMETPAPSPVQQASTPVDNSPKTSVKFSKYEHNFGNVTTGSKNKYSFSFTNTGSEPLIISSATGSCGCTVPNYPKEPIPPGGSGNIDVEFSPSAGQENAQQKTVTVMANTVPEKTELTIKAFVKAAS